MRFMSCKFGLATLLVCNPAKSDGFTGLRTMPTFPKLVILELSSQRRQQQTYKSITLPLADACRVIAISWTDVVYRTRSN